MEVKVKCVVSLIAYLNELNWFVQVHTCVGENTRPRSLILPTGRSTRLISFPWAPLANCRIIWQRTLYEHILLNRCKFSFCYPSVSATFGTAALYQKQLLWCSWTVVFNTERTQGWNDWENVLLPAKPWRCGKWDWHCSGCKGKCCTWKIHCFMVSIYFFFWFLIFFSFHVVQRL